MAVFENPANGYREEVGLGSSFGVFFFGGLYLIVKGLWAHVLVWWILVSAGFAVGPGGVLFTALILNIAYTFLIQGILERRYQERGWKTESQAYADRERERQAEELVKPQHLGASPSASVQDREKDCPFCAEKVKAAAIKCKHCGSDLPFVPEIAKTELLAVAPNSEFQESLMKTYHITFDGTYRFKEQSFTDFGEALVVAKQNYWA